MSNIVQRELCRLAVDAYKSVSAGGRNVTDKGTTFGKLHGELGKTVYDSYCKDPPKLSLGKIYYCQRSLKELGKMGSGNLESTKKELKESSGEEVSTEEAQEIQKVVDRNLHGHASS
jgi:hypothetical protein